MTIRKKTSKNRRYRFSFIKDTSFNSKRIDDPYIIDAYIPDKYYVHADDLPLSKRKELLHPVGLVAARSLKYFSINGDAFNIFRARGMAIWWLRHIYNSFNWWSAYVVNAEGERKNWPMLYIGENVGSAKGNKIEADIVLSAFENDRCLVSQESNGGAVFAVGYSERGGLFNSPDMYGVKIIVADKYKGAGITVTNSIKKNLRMMSEHLLHNLQNETTSKDIHDVIRKMKVVVLERFRHKTLVEEIESFGAEVIFAEDDDLTPTLLVARNEIDLFVGVGGVPEAVLSALIIENLGGEMAMQLIPAEIAQDEKLLLQIKNWGSFKKEEIDILKNFQIVRPGSEKEGEIPWNKVWTSSDLARGDDMVFTACVIKKSRWIKYADGEETPGVEIELKTGDITVHVVRITKSKLEIIPVTYKTAIGKFKEEYNHESDGIKRANILIQLIKTYIEFGLFQEVKPCLQKIEVCNNDLEKDLLLRSNAISEYVTGLDILKNKSDLSPEEVIEHFKAACRLDRMDKEGLRPRRMIKRYYEYLGDKDYRDGRHYKAMDYYRKALRYCHHELKIYRKLSSIEMMDMQKAYFCKIDYLYKELDFKELDDWNLCKLKTALEVFYANPKRQTDFSCANPWFLFFKKTVLHRERPSFKMAVLVKLLKLYNKLNYAQDDEIIIFLNSEFEISAKEIDIIINARREKGVFHSVSELYFIKELDIKCITRLLFPQPKLSIQNELEDSNIPLSITIVDAMERRTSNILEELREGYKEDAQEHQYSLAESYHYVGLAFYDIGDVMAIKIYYNKAIEHLNAIIQRFEGITPVNAQYRIGDLYYELGLLFPENHVNHYKKAIDAYMCIVDADKFIELFGNILDLVSPIRQEASNMVESIKRELQV